MPYKKRLTVTLYEDSIKLLKNISENTKMSVSLIIETLIANMVVTAKNNQVEKKGEN